MARDGGAAAGAAAGGFAFASVPVGRPTPPRHAPEAGLISAPGDRAEREARSVAEQVVPSASHPADTVAAARPPTPAKQPGSCATCGGAGHALGSRVETGRPLGAETRAEMEGALGTDLSAVRIHTGGEAARLSHSLDARAFTFGNDIFFDHAQYDPHSAPGKRLLAHELAHTIQQRDATATVARDGETPTTLKCVNDNLSAAGVASWLIGIVGASCGLVGAFAGSPTGPGAAGTAAFAASACIAFITGFAVGGVLAIIRGCVADPNFKSRGAYLSSNAPAGGAAPGAAAPGTAPTGTPAAAAGTPAEVPA